MVRSSHGGMKLGLCVQSIAALRCFVKAIPGVDRDAEFRMAELSASTAIVH
jgi:hypothetical protein